MNRPFDEAKYNALLEGLEISELKLSELENFMDFSPDYYKKDYLARKIKLEKFTHSEISQIAYVTDGEHGSPDWDETTNIKYITAEYVRPNYILDGEFKTISEKQNKLNARAALKEKDVLVYSVGAYAGYAAMTEPHLFPANIPRSVALIRLNEASEINAEFLTVFLNSSYGNFQSYRFRAGNAQPVLALEKINQFIVPMIGETFQNKIAELYSEAYSKRLESKTIYKQAENLLLEEVGLKDFEVSRKNTNATYLKESLFLSGRLDAEFYLPKYEEYHRFFAAKSDGKTLGDLATLRKGYQARSLSETGTLYASIKDADGFLINTTERTDQSDLILIEPKEIVLAITGATIGKTGINAGKENIAISGDLVGIKPHTVSPYFLQIVLSSEPIQEMCRQYTTGATNGHLTVSDVASFPIPLIDEPVQKTISQNVISAIEKRKESENLLEIAKRAVEIAIEETEEKAIEFINAETN